MGVKEKVNSDYKNEFRNLTKSWCLKCIKLINYGGLQGDPTSPS